MTIRRIHEKGFTLIELVVVIVLLGVLSIFAAPRMFDMKSVHALGLHDETLLLLGFAQKTAIAQRRLVCVGFTGNSATLYISAAAEAVACDLPLKGPGGETPGVVTGVEAAGYTALPGNFSFDGLGRPVDPAGVAMLLQTLQVNQAKAAIVVEPVTGYVHD